MMLTIIECLAIGIGTLLCVAVAVALAAEVMMRLMRNVEGE